MAKRKLSKRAGPAATLVAFLLAPAAHAAPPIRTNDANTVPACVTPKRLMSFVADRNPDVNPRFERIASFYKRFGEAWHVRWDYAFFQMVLETNYLSYRQGNGRRGDVWEDQNNFAGIGATGNGARGERFADIATGVHAQIQHLVAYSGEHVQEPLARRTRENQDDIIAQSRRVRHDMTFGDLARRWATDRAYGKSIDIVADLFREKYCVAPTIEGADDLVPPAPQPVKRIKFMPFRPPSGLGGPKPDHLAGPDPEATATATEEFLPWLTEPVKRPPASKAKPQAAKKSKSPSTKIVEPNHSHFKTIWSRGDTKTPPPAVTPPPPVADDAPSRARSAVEKSNAEAGVNAGTTAASPSAEDQTPWLPTFHIAPVAAVTASRLGGPLPELTPAEKAPAAQRGKCRILSASYGGTKTLLVRSTNNGELTLTTLTVLDGFEKSMFQNYANAEAKGAEIVGEYDTIGDALADARENCPD